MARVVIQRVRTASVSVSESIIASIDRGLLILIGIAPDDSPATVEKLADKIAVMRIFEDADGKMNLSAAEVGGSILVVSQFTLFADVRKGRRPSFIGAAPPQLGRQLYEHFCHRLASHGYTVGRGEFGADMLVSLQNDGPVTIVLDTADL